MLHCGAQAATWKDVQSVETPQGTDTWSPLGHAEFVDSIKRGLNWVGYSAVEGAEEYGLWKDGARLFGVMQIRPQGEIEDAGDYGLMIGFRNSHDKFFSTSVQAGSRVFVCDNLAMSGALGFFRKHTPKLHLELDGRIIDLCKQIPAQARWQDERFNAYRRTPVGDVVAHDVLIKSVDRGVMANSYIPKVLQEWREPTHDAFAERNAWSLFNGFTEALKAANATEIPERTTALHTLFDELAVEAGWTPSVN
jgi:hypothetical protein